MGNKTLFIVQFKVNFNLKRILIPDFLMKDTKY